LIRYDKSSLGKGDAEKRTETEKIWEMIGVAQI
jgi:hypothetical protein